MQHQPIVCNTSPLINLAGVGMLDVLPRLYNEIWIPESVLMEFERGSLATDPNLTMSPWLLVKPVVPSLSPTLSHLGKGESDAITLAQDSCARLLIIDDLEGRRIAQQRHIKIAGTLAVLLDAKKSGFLPAIRPIIDTMIKQGRYFNSFLYQRILSDAGEW